MSATKLSILTLDIKGIAARLGKSVMLMQKENKSQRLHLAKIFLL